MDNRTYAVVIRYIKEEILSGRLKPGTKLPPERELAEQLQVSRTSIREALRTMEVLGVMESVHGAGNYISVNFEKSMTEALSMMFFLRQTDSIQLNDIRQALELKAAELAIQKLTDKQIAEMQSIVCQMETAKDEETEAELDKTLHDTIACASENAILIQILSAMSCLIDEFIKEIRTRILRNAENQERLLRIHRSIVDGLRARDTAAVREAYRRHEAIIRENL